LETWCVNVIVFCMDSNLCASIHLFKIDTPKNVNVYDSSGIYGLTCATCRFNFVGQTGRSLKQPYSEHTRYIQYNNPLLAYTNHILPHAHKFESMQNTRSLTHRVSKWCLMDIWEQFCNQKYNYKHILI